MICINRKCLSYSLPIFLHNYASSLSVSPVDEVGGFGQFQDLPDISIFCTECNKHIALQYHSEHNYYHRALLIMKYKGKQDFLGCSDRI